MDAVRDYEQFLENKIEVEADKGIEQIQATDLHPSLFHHQRVTVEWALHRGRALIAKSFGLGKSRDQIEIIRQIHLATGGKALIVAPLGVKHQFQEEDGPAMGVEIAYVRTDAEVEMADTPYLITNYERVRDGDIDPRNHNFAVVTLDEGSVLRSLGSKTYDVFERIFANVPYRYVCTATPSPNEYRELIYYARFLGIMDVGQSLTRWFKRDSTKAGNLTLYKQHEKQFWLWVASWALFIYKPSDVGGDDDGYDLPPLNVHWHRVAVDHRRAWEQTDNRGQARLLLNAANGVQAASAEKRETMEDRLEQMMKIVLSGAVDESGGLPSDQWVIWCHLNDEQDAVEKAAAQHGFSVSSIFGSLSIDEAERRLYEWLHRKTDILLGKPVMLGSGLNLQQCNRMIFLGIDYKFSDFIQAVHRVYRFQQHRPVDVHIIYAESEQEIVNSLQRKWEQHNVLVQKMQDIVRKYGLASEAMKNDLKRKIGVDRVVKVGNLFTAVNNDCVRELPNIATDSIGLIHTSIPFGNHYEYTTNVEDFGHNPTNADFWDQMDFLIPQLLRVLSPGRVAAIHVKDRILYGHQTASGFMEVAPFSDECVMAFRKHGFMYEGRRTIATDVVQENNQTYRLGWTEMSKDASKMGSGSPEYLLLFRKPPTSADTARADEPVTKDKADYSRGRWQVDAHAIWRSSGNRLITPEEYADIVDLRQVAAMFEHEQMTSVYDYERHVAICEAIDDRGHLPATYMLLPPKVTRGDDSLVWDDVIRMRVLNSEQQRRKVENHVCPLPFDIVTRTIRLYSNEGDVVLDPFGGLMTVPYKAMEMGRRGYGIELNSDYFHWGVDYCRQMEQRVQTPTLFDLLEKKFKEN